MNRKAIFIFLFSFFPFLSFLSAQEVLRGEVRVELEPIIGGFIDVYYPLDTEGAHRRALEEAAMFFSAMIYGWSFHYEIGERARGIEEVFELTPLGQISWGDPGLFVTHARLEGLTLSAWMDYRPTPAQRRRLQMWRMGNIRPAQAIGHGPWAEPRTMDTWVDIRRMALEDAARAAVRGLLQSTERNRPKEASGFISLESFPAYWVDGGRWAVRARFRVEIREIIPFAAF